MDFGSQRIKRISITDEVVKRIQEQITSGNFPVGQKLPSEGEMQKSFGVGRSTIREAIRVLVAMGLIEMRTGVGAFVKNIHEPSNAAIEDWMVENEERLADLMDIRTLIEIRAVELAIERGTSEEFEQIAEIHEEFKRACEDPNPVKLAKLDEEFHKVIAMVSKNVYLIQLAKVIAQGLRDFRAHTFSHQKFMYNALLPHSEISSAMRDGNVKKAVAAMKKHMDDSLHDLRIARNAYEEKEVRGKG